MCDLIPDDDSNAIAAMAFDSHHARSDKTFVSVLRRGFRGKESEPSSTVAIVVEKAAGGVMPQRATNRETGDDMRIIINWNSGVRCIQKAMWLYTLWHSSHKETLLHTLSQSCRWFETACMVENTERMMKPTNTETVLNRIRFWSSAPFSLNDVKNFAVGVLSELTELLKVLTDDIMSLRRWTQAVLTTAYEATIKSSTTTSQKD